MNTIKAILSDHPLLSGLSHEHLEAVAACGEEISFNTGQMLFRQGEPAERFYLVLEGAVVLEAHDEAAKSPPLQTLGPGEIVGWSWLFQPFRWQYQARALKKTRAICFNGAHLLIACERDHELGYDLMKRFAQVIIHRLQETRKRYLAALAQLEEPARA